MGELTDITKRMEDLLQNNITKYAILITELDRLMEENKDFTNENDQLYLNK